MVTSSRRGRPAVDDIGWDARPPHFAPDAPNEYAHLFVSPAARGPALFREDPTYPGLEQVDAFRGGAGPGGLVGRDVLEILKTVVFVALVVLVAAWLMIAGAEKRLRCELKCAVLEALATRAPGPPEDQRPAPLPAP